MTMTITSTSSFDSAIDQMHKFNLGSSTTIDFKISKYNEKAIELLREECKIRNLVFRSIIKGNEMHIVIQGSIISLLEFFEFAKGLFLGLQLEENRRKDEDLIKEQIAQKNEKMKSLPKV